ncbi:MAG: hypothetical protein L0216_07460 [Planctomycetales bacterium]|nr:hypothetical protein [Planctomycetales bacterium]
MTRRHDESRRRGFVAVAVVAGLAAVVLAAAALAGGTLRASGRTTTARRAEAELRRSAEGLVAGALAGIAREGSAWRPPATAVPGTSSLAVSPAGEKRLLVRAASRRGRDRAALSVLVLCDDTAEPGKRVLDAWEMP